MSVTHHGRQPVAAEPRPRSAPARRVSRRRWQDPRLWVGIVFVALSVVIGARLMAAADDTVPVWRLTTSLQAGDAVTADLVDVAHVHFDDPEAATAYVAAGVSLPDGLVAARPLGVGELLPVTAVSASPGDAPRELPLAVSAGGVPTELAAGDLVDVWAVPAVDTRAQGSARVLAGVTVVALSGPASGSLVGDRHVMVAVPDQVDLGTVLDRLNEARVVLVRVGG